MLHANGVLLKTALDLRYRSISARACCLDVAEHLGEILACKAAEFRQVPHYRVTATDAWSRRSVEVNDALPPESPADLALLCVPVGKR